MTDDFHPIDPTDDPSFEDEAWAHEMIEHADMEDEAAPVEVTPILGPRNDDDRLEMAQELSKQFIKESLDEEAARRYFQGMGWDIAIFTDSYYERMIVEFWKIDKDYPLARPESFLAMYSGYDAETISLYKSTGKEVTN
jgi:hypothetical protein